MVLEMIPYDFLEHLQEIKELAKGFDIIITPKQGGGFEAQEQGKTELVSTTENGIPDIVIKAIDAQKKVLVIITPDRTVGVNIPLIKKIEKKRLGFEEDGKIKDSKKMF
ncbi:MAG: hypothetical protein NTY47_07340, partial [Candidatus Omnitrophica bacterium]|nr:hypothetical protein [Candidatus Omnitrophota bacterium]